MIVKVKENKTVQYDVDTTKLSVEKLESVLKLHKEGKPIKLKKNSCFDTVQNCSIELFDIGDCFLFECDIEPNILQSPFYFAITEPLYSDVVYNSKYSALISVNEDRTAVHVARCEHISSDMREMQYLEAHYKLQ